MVIRVFNKDLVIDNLFWDVTYAKLS